MKKKLFSLMMMCLFAIGAFAQEIVQIGSGTSTNNYIPSYTYQYYAISQQIYTAEEIGPAGTISSIAIYNNGTTRTRLYDVYMVLTDKASFTGSYDWVTVTAADLVYSDSVTWTQGQWNTITLDTLFEYDGESNVLLVMNDKTGDDESTSNGFYAFYQSDAYRTLYAYRGLTGGAYNPTASMSTISGSRIYYRNQVRLGIEGRDYSADLPTNSYYKFGVTQQLYTAAEIDTTGDITKIAFYNGGVQKTRNLNVYFTLVDDTITTIDNWIEVDSTDLVFSGNVTFTAGAWTEIPVHRLTYDGTQNLVITFDDNTDIAQAGLNFLVMEDVVANSSMYYFSDDSTRVNPDPTDLSGITGTSDSLRNMVKFTFTPTGLVEIGSGTSTSSNLPTHTFYNYSLTNQIYTKEEINYTGDIESIAFYNAGSTKTRNINIYFMEVDTNVIASNTAWFHPTAADLVYSGEYEFTAGQWDIIPLDEAFAYDGTHNLAIIIDDNTGSYSSGLSCRTFSATNQALYLYSDGTNYDPMTITTSGTRPTNKNQIQLRFHVDGPDTPLDPDLYFLDSINSMTPITRLDMGFRPNGAWMRPAMWTLYNKTGRPVYVRDHDFTPNPDFFTLVEPETPFSMDVDGLMPFYFDTEDSTTAGLIERQFALLYDTRAAGVWDICVTMYDPIENDVYELATELDMDDLPYLDTLYVWLNDTTQWLYDNYDMLPLDTVPGLVNYDAVYKLTFDDDVLFNAWVYGENAKVALYTEDFYEDIYGIPGPDCLNNYEGPIVGGGSSYDEPYDVIVGDSASTSGYYPFYTFYRNSVSQQIFTATELNAAGVQPGLMEQIGFLTYSNWAYTQDNVKIWMGTTDMDAFESPYETVLTDNMDLVYDDEFTPVVGWNMIELDGGFYWDGVSNIMIAVQSHADTYHSGLNWVRANTTFESVLYKYNDTQEYDMTSEAISANHGMYRNVVRFTSGVNSRGTIAGNNNNVANNYRNRDDQEIEQGFENGLGDWTFTSMNTQNGIGGSGSYPAGIVTDAAHEGTYGFRFSSYTSASDFNQYLVSPELTAGGEVTMSFYYKAGNSYGTESFKVGYSTTNTDIASFTFGDVIEASSTSWTQSDDFVFPAGTKYVAINYCSDYMYYMFVDDITITAEESGGGDDPYYAEDNLDFEAGYWPEDWTVIGDWYIDTCAHNTTHKPIAKQGKSAFFNGVTPADTADLIMPETDFVGYSVLTFDYIATTTNKLEVLYGPSMSHLTRLWAPTGSATWQRAEIDLTELGEDRGEYIIVFRATGGTGVTAIDNIRHLNYGNADASIEDMTVEAGTYYLVVSSTNDSTFMVRIDAEAMPCPEMASMPIPIDDADDLQPRRVDLAWQLGEYTTEYRLVFGSTYYCEEVLVDWTSDLAESYTVRNLYNNTNYFWRVDERNSECETIGEVWGFTTHLNVPDGLGIVDESLFEGETALLYWDNIDDRTFRQYNIYVDGVLYGSTPMTYDPTAYTYYEIEDLTYNMNPGYAIQVSALYDEGESDLSEPIMVKVSGYGSFFGHVWEQDGVTGIEGAEIIIAGYNEFNETFMTSVTTSMTGAYSVVVPVSSTATPYTTISYTLMAHKDGYQGYQTPLQGYPLAVVYNQNVQADFILDEEFLPVSNVWAEYYPDITSDDEYVKVYWTAAGNMIGAELTVCDGTSTSSYIPVYGLWHDDYTRDEMIYPADMLAPLAGTQINSLKYYISSPSTGSWAPATFNVYLMEVSSTTLSSYYGSTDATVVYSGELDGTGSEMVINFTTPYHYNGGNLLVGIEQPVEGTYHSCYFYGIQSTGSSASGYSSSSLAAVTFNQRNFLPKTTFNGGRGGEMAKGGDRAFHHYRIYRTSCYNDGPYNSDNTVMLASDWPTDTVYIDTNFDTVSPGVYKWGVSCVYEGNRSTDYPNPDDRESDIVWSNCLDKDMYLDDVDVTVLLNSADSPEGTRVSFVNVNPIEQELYPMTAVTLGDDGYYEWSDFRRGTYEITVSKAGYETETEIVTIDGPTHLRYVLTEIIYGVENIYVSRTGWAMWDPIAPSGPGSIIDFETGDFSQYDFDNSVTSYPWTVTSETAFEGNYCMKSTNSGIASSTSAIEATVNMGSDGTVSFAALCQGEGTSTIWDKCRFLIDGAEQFSYGANMPGWNEYSFPISSGSHILRWEYSKDGSVNPTGDAMYVDNISFSTGRSEGDRHLEGYKVMCTSIDGVPIFTNNTLYPHPFCQLTTFDPNTGLPFLEEGEHYIVNVCAIYSTGQSGWASAEFEYEPCEHWGPVDEVTASTEIEGNHIEWVFENGYNPYDPSGPTPGPTPGDNVTVTLTADDVWGDGSGYQMLLDDTHSLYGTVIPETGALSTSCSGNEAIYNQFSHKIPTNADGNCSTQNMVNNTSVTITIPAGTYDWCITNPTPGDRIWIASSNGTIGGRYDDFTFEAGNEYEFHVYFGGYNDAVDLNVIPGNKGIHSMGQSNDDCKTIDDVTPVAFRGEYGGGDLQTGMLATGLYAFNITDIASFDERVFFISNLTKDERFEVIVDKNNSVFLINTGKYHENEDLESNVNAFVAENAAAFAAMDKETAAETCMTLKSELSGDIINALMLDIYASSRENNLCALGDPFCTDNGMYEFPAGVNAGSGEAGPDYNCLYTQPNPAWYYMRIGNPGAIDIYMYSTPSVDIDFCCWGPFDDPIEPCPNGLTANKVVSCSYSAAATEHCNIPATAQTGEYYILVITNYSNQPCNINFSQVAGSGNTDCGILPPVDIIGFLITLDGEYLDIVGPTVREYTHYGEYGDHEYCVRPIYPGEMTLPSNNFGWSMGCPVCDETNGEMSCEPGMPISGVYYWESGDDFGAVISWGGEPTPPTPPAQGDEFSINFDDSQIPAGWTVIDGGNPSGFGWQLASTKLGAGYGHNGSADCILSQSYDNTYGVVVPDNWFISPAVTLGDASLFSFWACGQDASYAAEHCGVFVSTTGTNPSDFTMVNEWTLSAKSTGEKTTIRGTRDQGTWRQYTVDLSEYAGEARYIAIRHFNCSDMFYLDVDDLELSNGAKRDRAELIAFNVYRSVDLVEWDLIGIVPAEEGTELYEYYDNVAAGDYYYAVTAVYDNGCESDFALSAINPTLDYVYVQVTGIDDLEGRVALYPNPTNGLVKIEAQGMTHISVVSILGQMVFDSDVNADQYEINMAQFNAGVYVVRIATEYGVSTQRVTVVK